MVERATKPRPAERPRRRRWTVLRYTWADVNGRPEHVAASIRSLLGALARAQPG